MRKVRAARKSISELFALVTVVLGALVVIAFAGFAVSPLTGWEWIPIVGAQAVPEPVEPPIASLKGVPVPGPDPAELAVFVKDEAAANKLGKAFFWDMQVGSDGLTACATCHFNAGIDSRSKNTLHPGPDGVFEPAGGPNSQLSALAFPRSRLGENDVVGSQGVQRQKFIDIIPGSPVDAGIVLSDPVFNVGGSNTRQVTGRNTPNNINSVFNFHNFWDGRADNTFNGVSPFGARDPNAVVLKSSGAGLEKVEVRLKNSAPASQAVGPPLSDVEMSWAGRTFPKIGKKMLSLQPLGRQQVHREDSVLGSDSLSPAPGISVSYEQMIMDAFQAPWWDSDILVDGDLNVVGSGTPASTDEFTLMEANFSLIWGLAIQAYMRTLISDDSPFDRFKNGESNALTSEQISGMQVFNSEQAACSHCHAGPTISGASVAKVSNERLERMIMGDDGRAVYDNGFYNIGVRPTAEDLGRGGSDPFGNPLSEAQLAKDKNPLFPTDLSTEGAGEVGPDERVAKNGAFKTPTLRNIELSAPYFHNGGKATLEDAVKFYVNRDFSEDNIDDLDPEILDIAMGGREIREVVAFLKSLTDERVRFQRAPFDHPQLFIPTGHPGDQISVTDDGNGQATQLLLEIPAVGRNGLLAPVTSFPVMSFSVGEPPPLDLVVKPGASMTLEFDTPQGTLVISWERHSHPAVVGYNVYRSASPGVPMDQDHLVGKTNSATDTTFLDSELTEGTTFFYVITARDAAGNETSPSGEVPGTTLLIP